MKTLLPLLLATAVLAPGCTVYDDISIDVVVPMSVQDAFLDIWPDKYMRPIMMFDDEVASLGVECELMVQEQTYFARYLEAGCYDAHHVDIYITALDVEAGVPCAHDFQVGVGARDLPSYEPSLSLDIPATDNGRCGSEWTYFEMKVNDLAPPLDE